MTILAAGLAGIAGCTDTHWSVLPYPIPLTLSGTGGGLVARATVGGGTEPFPIVVDTGTILTTYDDGTMRARAETTDLTVYGIDGSGASISRLSFTNLQLFEGPLGSLGVGGNALKVGGVLGGDNLSRFAVSLDYRGAAPTMTLQNNVPPCNCELQPTCERQDSCFAVLPFSLAGGQDTSLQGETRIVLGDNQYTYPPTRVLLGACVEPLPDPVAAVPCVPEGSHCPGSPAYVPSGVDMQLVVATGFPGLALSANAYDRLRGAGAAMTLLSGPVTTLHLVDPDDEGPIGAGVQAATTTLGALPTATSAGAAPLALVSNEFYYGPCASLARSRRIRRAYTHATQADYDFQAANDQRCSGELCCMLGGHSSCLGSGSEYVDVCRTATNGATRCYDDTPDTPSPAVVEMKTPLDVFVMADVTPLLVGLNADVRPTVATIDGVIGTELLAKLVSTIDYPGGRLIAQCAREDECVAFPRLSIPSPAHDCGFCSGPMSMASCPTQPGLLACPPAP